MEFQSSGRKQQNLQLIGLKSRNQLLTGPKKIKIQLYGQNYQNLNKNMPKEEFKEEEKKEKIETETLELMTPPAEKPDLEEGIEKIVKIGRAHV